MNSGRCSSAWQTSTRTARANLMNDTQAASDAEDRQAQEMAAAILEHHFGSSPKQLGRHGGGLTRVCCQ